MQFHPKQTQKLKISYCRFFIFYYYKLLLLFFFKSCLFVILSFHPFCRMCDLRELLPPHYTVKLT